MQVAFVILILLLTFSRTECPCPKTFDGQEDYDEEAHFNVCDFQPAIIDGKRVLKVRFRRIEMSQASLLWGSQELPRFHQGLSLLVLSGESTTKGRFITLLK